MFTTVIYAGLFFLAVASALLVGTRDEKVVALVLLVGNLSTIGLLAAKQGSAYLSISVVYFLIDAIATVILCWVAVKAPTWMTVLVAVFQINGTLGHLVKLVSPTTIQFSYAFLLRIWAWPMILVVIAARLEPRLQKPLRQSDLRHVTLARRTGSKPMPLRPGEARHP